MLLLCAYYVSQMLNENLLEGWTSEKRGAAKVKIIHVITIMIFSLKDSFTNCLLALIFFKGNAILFVWQVKERYGDQIPKQAVSFQIMHPFHNCIIYNRKIL